MDSLTASTQIEGLDSLLPLLEEARHEEALPIIEERLAKQPDVPLWIYLKALISAGKGRGVEAAGLLNELSGKPGFSEGFGLPPDVNTLAKTSALNHLTFEASVEPTNLDPWNSLERVAEILGSEGFVTKAVMGRWKARPEDEAMPRKFEKHFADKSIDDKIRIIENLLEEHPESCLPRACLGYYMQEKGKTALAIRHLKKALDTDGNAWQPHLYLGRVFYSQGRFEDAENRFSEAVQLREEANAELLSAIALCQKATYRYDEALESFFKAFEQFPSEFASWSDLEELSSAMGASERLVQAVKKVAAQDPTNLSLAARVVNLALNGNDPLEARRLIEASRIVDNPNKSAEMTKLAARMFQLLEEGHKASKLLEALVQSHPEDLDLRVSYGLSLVEAERPEEGEAVLREVAKKHPYDKGVQLAWGHSLMALGQAENAQRSFTAAARMAAGDPEPLTQQGRALVALGKVDEAMAVLKESTKIATQPSPDNLVALGKVYEKKRVPDIARDFFRQALVLVPGEREAGRGWLRMFRGQLNEFKEETKKLFNERPTAFGLCQLYENLLLASLYEGFPEAARMLHQDLLRPVKAGMKSEEYSAHLEKSLIKQLPLSARALEKEGRLENAREIWRFAVTSNQAELAEKATAELLRLDTVEAAMSDEEKARASAAQAEIEPPLDTATSLEPLSSDEGGDPLLSLLTSTLPEDGEIPLFEAPSLVAPAPTTASEEAPLFASELPDLSSAAEAVTRAAAQPLEPTPVPTPPKEAVISTPVVPAEQAVAPAPLPPADAPTKAIQVPLPPPSPPAESPTQPSAAPAPPPQAALPTPPAVPVAPEPPMVVPAPPTAPEPPIATPAPPEPAAPSPQPVQPMASAIAAAAPEASPAQPVAADEEERKDLLPIPMAVDFEPQTRRQLHFHEALVQNQGGLLSPESIAHLMVCSSLGHEPPDPSSDEMSSVRELQQALLQSARQLTEAGQYRAAGRVLKTALLYSPEAKDLQNELIKVTAEWAGWLVGSQEFAHAVALVRDALHRRPDSPALLEQLEAIYQSWMDWTDEKGDNAARDLLSVYLQQEKTALVSFREVWKERATQRVAPPQAAPVQPRVEPSMPPPAPQPQPPTPEAAAPAVPAQAPPAPTPVAPEPVAPEPVATVVEAPPEPVVAKEAAPPEEPVEEQPPAVVPPSPVVAAEATPAPEAAPAEEPAPEPVAASASFTSSEQALAALDADPANEAISGAVFAFHKDSMRALTTALRDRVSANEEPIWLLLLARAFRQGGSETMAVIQYQKYIKAAPSPEAYEELAQTYEEIGKEDFATMTRRKAERAFS